MSFTTVNDRDQALELAEWVKNPLRRRPVIVTSTTSGNRPEFDIAYIAERTGHVADAYLLITGAPTQVFSASLPDRAGAYGGAARVYPVGTHWLDDVSAAPFFLGQNPDTIDSETESLIRAALGPREPSAPAASGLASRLDPAVLAALGEAAAAAATAPTRVDPPANRAPSTAAIVSAPGDDNLGYLGRSVARPDAKSLPDHLRAKLSRNLLSGPSAAEQLRLQEAVTRTIQAALDAEVEAAAATRAALQRELDAVRADAASERDRLALEAAEAHAASNRTITELRSELVRLDAELGDAVRNSHRLQRELRAVKDRARAPKPRLTVQQPAAPSIPWNLFTEEEDAVRHAIYLTWAEAVHPSDKAGTPLPDYRVGEHFAASLREFTEPQQRKALRCVVDTLTGRSAELASRAVHVLRTSEAGDTPAVTREDGAVCFRANIETNTASARRLHYWKLTDGGIELSRAVQHDDFEV